MFFVGRPGYSVLATIHGINRQLSSLANHVANLNRHLIVSNKA
jgi:hypothetical protein